MAYIAKPTTCTVGGTDWKAHVIAVSLSGGEEIIDARTFGAPRATTTGGGQDSVTITMAWSDAAAILIAAKAGTDVTLALGVDGGSWGGTIHIPDAPPTPTFTIGEKAEVDLVCGVVTALAYTT